MLRLVHLGALKDGTSLTATIPFQYAPSQTIQDSNSQDARLGIQMGSHVWNITRNAGQTEGA